jgi:hypothetical protein
MPVLAKLNLSTEEWEVSVENLELFVVFVQVGFTANSLPVFFDRLSFGFSARANEEKILEVSHPKEGILYESTDQEYLTTDLVTAIPDSTVYLDFWVENNGKRYEHSFSFISIRPIQTYPSWVWSPEQIMWEPPVEYPEDESLYYVWDEDSLSWIPEEEES